MWIKRIKIAAAMRISDIGICGSLLELAKKRERMYLIGSEFIWFHAQIFFYLFSCIADIMFTKKSIDTSDFNLCSVFPRQARA